MRDLTEFNKLEQYCKDNNISYERIDREYPSFIGETFDKHIIFIYKSEEDKKDDRKWFDAICQYGSYGGDEGLLEIMGDIVQNDYDSVEGWLTADEIIARM